MAIQNLPQPISNPELTEEFISAWMATKVVAVDVETDFTLIPRDHGSQALYWNEDGSHKANTATIGTSYAAPITDIALVAKGLEPVVFDMRGYNIYTEDPDPDTLSVSIFIAELLSRPHITIVGHNVAFDLRQLGGHYDFEVHLDSMVWGTQVMGIRMSLAEDKSKGAFGAGFSLKELARHLGLIKTGTATYQFLDLMKSNVRSNISDVLNAVEGSPNPEHFWDYLGGKPEDEEEQIKLAHAGIELYVVADAYLAYRLYKMQLNFARSMSIKDTNIKCYLKYPSGERPELIHYPFYPEIMDHIVLWQQQMVLSCNWAIRGIPFDTKQAIKRQEAASKRFEEIMEDMPVLAEEDIENNFRIMYDTLHWYDMILAALRKRAQSGKITSVVNYQPNGEELPYWNNVQDIGKEKLNILLWKYLDTPDNMKDFWIDLLIKIKPSEHYTNGRLNKLIGDTNLPAIPNGVDTVAFCVAYDNNFKDALDDATAQWKAICRDRWLKYLFKQREEVTSQDLWSKQAWKPYFIYVVSGMPLPLDEDFYQSADLTTDTIKTQANDWTRRTKNYGVPAPYRDFLIRQRTGLSFNRKALDFYIKEIERQEAIDLDTTPFKLFKEVSEADGLISRVTEFLAHSSVDGRIHSLTIPGTRTGRDRSSSPNIQNMKMQESYDFGHKYTFAGLIIAVAGAWLIELDYSNAENKTGAMISGDNLFAIATEFGDFHMQMAISYWSGLPWGTMNSSMRSKWRKLGKIITFGVAYGMGIAKLAASLKITIAEAKQIIDDKDRAFPEVAKAKAQTESQIAKMASNRLNMFPYVELWDKQRVTIPRYIRAGDEFDVPGYKGWNFRQQGGVSVLIHRAAIRINRMLHTRGYQTHIAFNVHDSLILSMDIKEYYETNILQEIVQVMVDVMPKDMCERTIPHIEFVATADIPGNAQKWGYHDEIQYPFPKDEYTDYWGHRVPLPEDEASKPEEEREAPTRKAGPEWDFDPEKMADHHRQQGRVDQNEPAPVINTEKALQEYKDSIEKLDYILVATGHEQYMSLHKDRKFKLSDDEIMETNGFVDRFLKSGYLFAKKIEAPYQDVFKRILFILQETEDTDLKEWLDDHHYLVPDSFRTISIELRRKITAKSQESEELSTHETESN